MASHMEREFPKIVERYRKCAKALNIVPLFYPFFNWCINAPRAKKRQKRVHCKPHVDAQNLAIGICVLWIYSKLHLHFTVQKQVTPSTGKFNSKERSWLVIWEAGVILELPAGVFLMYPSSLFFHFNIDLEGEPFPAPHFMI